MRSRCAAAWPRLSVVVLLLCAACACAETDGSQRNAAQAPPPKPLAGAELAAGYRDYRTCHQAVADTDFVSRNYLPFDLRRKLK